MKFKDALTEKRQRRNLLINTFNINAIKLYCTVTVWFSAGLSSPSLRSVKSETLLPASQGLVTLEHVFVDVYIWCVCAQLFMSLCLLLLVSKVVP